ncbi:NEW3 domain-containing protein [Sphaerisporangium sp. TRM90804]|uniref:glycoside hydrolase family 38 N-terminal domain-containing protein n=1 Tax=Sphaerisporangium sp. TRM90804 TaxID=3031113 RepID=UPI00244C07C8|nr:NEW3 domain-containing protein [Sphaerisporangium sp. TRM90804]MDH2425330.1 NEW3 domain-containing protein [Sphaerisporangium sp. TRM90804]
MPVTITAVESTDLFVGTEDAARQVLRVTLDGPPVRVTVTGPGVAGEATGTGVVEVPLDVAAPVTGAELPVTVTAGEASAEAVVTVAEPGWTMFLVSHFHYDPVWWNTQAAYTSPWELLSGDATTRPLWERNGFALVDAHLDLALRDPVYRFVLAEIDYLKPYFDLHPERRADLRLLMERGQVELVGGTYNEPNTNLTGAETTIRNIVYGVGYQRDILGGDPRTAWQLDVFGHDPQFPGYLDAAGLTGSAWARGPFHQWGPIQKNFRESKNDARVMQFPSEFEWISPSGRGVLTHFMPHHYSAGWWMDSSPDLPSAEQAVYELYAKLKPVGATRNLLLPVGTDYTPPNKWVTEVHRSWAEKYVWPRFVCGTPRDFLDAVRAELAATGRRPSPQTRDMNPVYTGKDVSYIDTKQAQRAGEVAAVDAEKLATLAALEDLGTYPGAALDKVWRQLAYGAHHDAITGSESDQVYIDLLSGWREAHDLAAGVRDAALAALAGRVDTTGDGVPVVVANTLSFDRSALVAVRLPDGLEGGRVVDDSGAEVACVVDRGTLRFHARDVPAMGWRTWRLLPGTSAEEPAWAPAGGAVIENERYVVTADPARGGGLRSVYDKASGRELVRDGHVGNELRVYEEYPAHPDFGEGPWHLIPRGPVVGSSESPATVRAETSPLGSRLVVTGTVDGIGYRQTVTLWHGVDRVDFGTRVVDHAGADRLLRVRFPVDLPGALPVSEVAGAVVGRGFALPDVDSAEAPWTLDNPANTWFGLSSTARVSLADPGGTPLGDRALGVAEVVVPALDDAADARDLVVALARVGVTATTASAGWARYGWLDVDSNLPDFRIVIGGPQTNEAARDLLQAAGAEYAETLARHGRVWVPAGKPLHEVWRPNADLRDLRALPALVVTDAAALAADLADARVSAVCPGPVPEPEVLTDHTVGLLTFGLPGFAVDPTGAMHLSLMRSCTGWPSGVWIDPPKRTAPDGTSFQLQHWTHDFSYALVSGDGDWRAATLPARGQEFNHPLYAVLTDAHEGPLPPTRSYLRVEPARDVLLGTVKPTGDPIAQGSAAPVDPSRGVTLRLMESTGLATTTRLTGALDLTALRTADLLERPGDPLTGPIELTGSEVATVIAVPGTPRPGAPTPVDGTPPAPGHGVPAPPQHGVPGEPGHGAPASAAHAGDPASGGGGGGTLGPVTQGAQLRSVAEGGRLGPVAEIAQPVHARYWLHNRGPAPLGYLPVSVAVSPGLARATGGEPVEASVVISSQLRDAAVEGAVVLVAPEGWTATPARRPYRLEPDGHLRFPVTLTPPPGVEPGLYFLATRIEHDGQSVEDVATIAVGDLPGLLPVPGAIPEDWAAAQGTTAGMARDTGLSVDVVSTSVRVEPGGRGALGVTLANWTRGEIRGELQVVSPWGTWDAIAAPVRGFTLAAGAEGTVTFDVTVPRDADPGSYWALAKVMWFGRCQYAPTVKVVVAP